jgi:iron-sulfur cluster repair protein YtfE (RIC family)
MTAVPNPGRITKPLHDEHRELLPHVEGLQAVADSIGVASTAALRRGIDDAYAFLTQHLIPHAQAEEQALYPVVGRVMGAPEATKTMSHDHVAVGRLTEELGVLRGVLGSEPLSEGNANALRRVLYGLYTLVKVHFAKEEEVYLPLLDVRLTPEEAQRMFEAMEAAAKHAKDMLAGTGQMTAHPPASS